MLKHTLDFTRTELASGRQEVDDIGSFFTNRSSLTVRTHGIEPSELSANSNLTSGADSRDNITTATFVLGKRTNSDGLIANNKGIVFRNTKIDADHGNSPGVKIRRLEHLVNPFSLLHSDTMHVNKIERHFLKAPDTVETVPEVYYFILIEQPRFWYAKL